MDDLEDRVVAFVSQRTAVSPALLTLNTTLFGDLGVDGADGWELIEEFGREFDVDLATFKPAQHFGPEASGCLSFAAFRYLFLRLIGRKPEPHAAVGQRPISIRDLIDSAHHRIWRL